MNQILFANAPFYYMLEPTIRQLLTDDLGAGKLYVIAPFDVPETDRVVHVQIEQLPSTPAERNEILRLCLEMVPHGRYRYFTELTHLLTEFAPRLLSYFVFTGHGANKNWQSGMPIVFDTSLAIPLLRRIDSDKSFVAAYCDKHARASNSMPLTGVMHIPNAVTVANPDYVRNLLPMFHVLTYHWRACGDQLTEILEGK